MKYITGMYALHGLINVNFLFEYPYFIKNTHMKAKLPFWIIITHHPKFSHWPMGRAFSSELGKQPGMLG